MPHALNKSQTLGSKQILGIHSMMGLKPAKYRMVGETVGLKQMIASPQKPVFVSKALEGNPRLALTSSFSEQYIKTTIIKSCCSFLIPPESRPLLSLLLISYWE